MSPGHRDAPLDKFVKRIDGVDVDKARLAAASAAHTSDQTTLVHLVFTLAEESVTLPGCIRRPEVMPACHDRKFRQRAAIPLTDATPGV